MYRPVTTERSTILPVSLAEMKRALRILEVDGDGNPLAHEDDLLVEGYIRSAVDHYEGWSGVLGIVIREQTVRQDFDGFGRCLSLLIGPVINVVAVRWIDAAGVERVVATDQYRVAVDMAGRVTVRFVSDFVFPKNLDDGGAVSITYRAGWKNKAFGEGDTASQVSTVPDDIKTAIKLRVQMLYDEAAQANAKSIEAIEDALISKYRRAGV